MNGRNPGKGAFGVFQLHDSSTLQTCSAKRFAHHRCCSWIQPLSRLSFRGNL